MKKYICDVCKKEFGYNVLKEHFVQYKPNEFILDAGFSRSLKYDSDICSDCYNKITEAQENIIKQIKKQV